MEPIPAYPTPDKNGCYPQYQTLAECEAAFQYWLERAETKEEHTRLMQEFYGIDN